MSEKPKLKWKPKPIPPSELAMKHISTVDNMQKVLEEMKKDIQRFVDKDNRSSGYRIRKEARNIKTKLSLFNIEMLVIDNAIREFRGLER